MDPYEEYGSPDDPEDGCVTILAAAQANERHAVDDERRRWESVLRQLADTLAPDANIEIDPSDPEVSCARIAEAVGGRIADLETQRDAKEATIAMAVARLAGRVEGEPTHRINFLQRIDELRETEHWANEMSSRFI